MTSIQAGFEVYKDIPGYKAIFKAVLKNVIQLLVEQLSEQADEESVLLTASVTDGTLSHLGSESGRYFLEGHDEIKSQFLGFCLKRHHKRKSQETLQVPQPKRFAASTHSVPDFISLGSENDLYSTTAIPSLSELRSTITGHGNQLPAGHSGHISSTGHTSKILNQSPDLAHHVQRSEKVAISPISLTKVKRKQQAPLHRSRLAVESDKETISKSIDNFSSSEVETATDNDGVCAENVQVNAENVPNSKDNTDAVIGGDSHVRIKIEAPDYDEISKADSDKVNVRTGIVNAEKGVDKSDTLNERIEDNVDSQSQVASIKVEAVEEDSELQITGVEGDMNDSTQSFGGFGSGYADDGQLYTQGLSGLEGQRSILEGHKYNGDQAVGVIWLDEASTVYQNPITQVYGCGICNYKSPSKTNVKRHTRRHTCNQNQRPVCEYCNTSFIDKYKLRKHIEANHMGIRYVCHKCNRQFKSPYYLAVHKKCTPSTETSNDLAVDNLSADNKETIPVNSGVDSAFTLENIPVDSTNV